MTEIEHAFAIVLYVVVFGSPVWVPLAIYVYHQRKNPPVQVMSVEALMAAGFSQKEAIIEQGRQRREARDHVRTSTAIRPIFSPVVNAAAAEGQPMTAGGGQVGEDGAMETTNKTELLLELIANELLRLRLQMGSEADPEDLTRALAEKLDGAIIEARRELGLPWNPLTR